MNFLLGTFKYLTFLLLIRFLSLNIVSEDIRSVNFTTILLSCSLLYVESLWQPSILFGSISTQLQSSYRYWLLHSPDYYQECCLVNLIFLYCVYGYTALFLAAFFQDKLFFPPIYGLRFVYGLRIRSIQSLFQSFHRVYASQL